MMKTKQWISALALTVLVGTTQISCDSKKENKAEEVQDEREDVIEAQREGDTSEVRDEQEDLDSARTDYRDAAREQRRDSTR